MNFQTVNAKNFEDEIWKNCENMTYHFTEILMIGWHAEIEKRLRKKTKATELQIWKNHTTLLTPAHLTSISGKRILQHFSFIFSHMN